MIQEKGSNAPQTQGGGSRRKRDGFQPIQNEDLTVDPQTVKVLDIRATAEPREGQRKFSDYCMKVAFKGQTRLYYLTANRDIDRVFGVLLDAWGPDENNWVDKEFKLFIEVDSFNGRSFRRATVEAASPRRRNG